VSKIGTCASGDDSHLLGVVADKSRGLCAPCQFYCAFGPAYTAFAVGDEWQKLRFGTHPASGTEFCKGLCPIAAVVGGYSHGLPDCGDPPGAGACSLRVSQCGLWILVEEFTGCDEVPGDRVSGGLVEGEQLRPYFGGELFGLDVGGNCRTTGLVCIRAGFGRPLWLGSPGPIRT